MCTTGTFNSQAGVIYRTQHNSLMNLNVRIM